MRKETKRKIITFFIGLVIVSLASATATLAFLETRLLFVLRNVAITDLVFIAFYIVWIRLHRGYETFYKSGLELEEKK